MRQRISPKLAERLILEGNLYSSEELLAIGLIDKVVPRGKGIEAVEQIIRDSKRRQYTWAAHAGGEKNRTRSLFRRNDTHHANSG